MANYQQIRQRGIVSTGGGDVFRQPALKRLFLGNYTHIVFSIDDDIKGRYALIDASDLQPSHLGSSQNPLHFIPEAQPRNRSTSASGALTPERIARNLRPEEVLSGSTAYTGAPVVNQRGEVIQGNGRAYAIKLYYAQFPNDDRGYRKAIFDGNYRFGFLLLDEHDLYIKEQGIKQPVLVRMVDVPDRLAIELGQYTQADTEAVATNITKVKSKARLLNKPVLKRIINELNRVNDDDKTLAELIRSSKVLNVLIKENIIRVDDLENYTRNGAINEAGVTFVSSLLLNALFRKSDVNTSDVLTQLPVSVQNAIGKSTLYLLTCQGSKNLNTEVADGILAYRDFKSSGIESFGAWQNQITISGKSAHDLYTNTERAIAKLFATADTQKEIVNKFRQYATLVNGQAGNMFEGPKSGVSKREAVLKVFGVVYTPSTAILTAARESNRRLTVARKRVKKRITKRVATKVNHDKAEATKARGRRAVTVKRAQTKQANTALKSGAVRNLENLKPATLSTSIHTPMATAKKAKRTVKKSKTTAKKARPSAKKAGATTKKASSAAKTARKPMSAADREAFKKRMTAARAAKATLTGAKAARKKTATKKVAGARKKKSTVAVKSKKEQKGTNFILEVDKLAKQIHEKSATGRTKVVPVYGVSISEAKSKAFKALSGARRAKNVTNIRLKTK